MFKKILVPFDLSENSKKALDTATALALKEGASLVVLHVIPMDARLTAYGLYEPSTAMAEKIKNRIELLLNKETISWHIEVRWGEPVVDILEFVTNQTDIDLLVLGTHGHTGLKHVLLGSVAEKIIRHSPIPVLAVRQNYLPLKTILLPIDLGDEAEASLRMASELAKTYQAQLHVVHVLSMPDTYHLIEELDPTMLQPNMDEIKKSYQQKLEGFLSKHALPLEKASLLIGPVHEAICQHAKEIQADLILMPTHARKGLARFFMGSEAELVVRHATCNVLTFSLNEGLESRVKFLAGK